MTAVREKKVYTGYMPRTLQEGLHNQLKRFNVIVCHRRWGKTVFSLNEMIDKALRNTKRNPQYAYIAPTYGQAKRVAWDMLKQYTEHIPGVSSNEQDLKIEIVRPAYGDKVKLLLLGAENPGVIRGIYLDGCIMDEFAEMHPMVWGQVVRPTLSDREGWVIFIGTPKGLNHFKEMYDLAGARSNPDLDNWFRVLYKASETNILPPSELAAARVAMTEEEYAQEYEVDWGAGQVGAYYAKLITKAETEKRILRVNYDKGASVETYWDLGHRDTTAIWFIQSIGREYHVIDHLESSGVGLDWYVKQLKEKPYIYGEHVLPHDAGHHEISTGETRLQTLQKYGLGGRIRVLDKHSVDDGIHAVRMILDKCYFDDVKTKRGLECMRAYEKKWDAKNKIFSASPLHNWASHSADAFRTFAMGVRAFGRNLDERNLQRQAETDYDIFNYSGG